MLTTEDLNKIGKIVRVEVRNEVDKRTAPMRRSLVEIERDRKVLRDIWEFVKSHTTQLKDHEDRITRIETP